MIRSVVGVDLVLSLYTRNIDNLKDYATCIRIAYLSFFNRFECLLELFIILSKYYQK